MNSDNTTPSSSIGRSIGVLVIGLGGYNGVTLVGGVVANRNGVDWRGPQGQPRKPNYNGCITQLKSKGKYGGVGFSNLLPGLASFNDAAIGGWDIRSKPLGDALLDQQILDYDLVRQVKSDMNDNFPVMKGYFDPRFIGSKLHDDANHIIDSTNKKAIDVVNILRKDIQQFKNQHKIKGHTTVIWSASVEPNCELCLTGSGIDNAQELLTSLSKTDEERGGPLPPSLLYATAAVLEGCSFVNGGSQNTIKCNGLTELSQRKLGVYVLGTDFKAGQTKFKTAAVEYLRTMGLTPKVIASSNHLGNNDMKNLECSDKTLMAKLRVKHDIFAAWDEPQLDHKVAVMYTPEINDEKRDFVEYTSDGFLGQTHTMVTYTRAMDSVLCVPLMIDAAVWCDFFHQRHWSSRNVSKALAYLFKVPEGGAEGVDPGFFRQMEELKAQAFEACKEEISNSESSSEYAEPPSLTTQNGIPKDAEWIVPPQCSTVICAGLACVDMQLNDSTGGQGGEAIETFKGVQYIGGGSVAMACKTLARLSYSDSSSEPCPIFSSVVPLCKMGEDDAGHKLVELLKLTCTKTNNVNLTHTLAEQKRDAEARTALAVLPIYKNGSRGCFFDAASNDTFTAQILVKMVRDVVREAGNDKQVAAFLFGYPHLLPLIQGEQLSYAFKEAKELTKNGITALDLNGVPNIQTNATSMKSLDEIQQDPILGAALPFVDILHMNQDELAHLSGISLDEAQNKDRIIAAAELFVKAGVAIAAVTRGKDGCIIACASNERFQKSPLLPQSWAEQTVSVSASVLDTPINSNGAGDSFTAGLLTAALLRRKTKQQAPSTPSKSNKMTAYTLYMSEQYVTLKAQCQGDRKAIFEKCNELWETESATTREEYARKAKTINDDEQGSQSSSAIDAFDKSYLTSAYSSSLTLNEAASFAGLVAARHVDVSTRDNAVLNVSSMLKLIEEFLI